MQYTQLASQLRGELRTDALAQAMYATDASIYQIPPLGVVLPRDEGDVYTTCSMCASMALRLRRVVVQPAWLGRRLGQVS